jgi:hypothetical protein
MDSTYWHRFWNSKMAGGRAMKDTMTMKPEFQKPGMNPFFAALAGSGAQPKVATLLKRLFAEIRDLEKIA